MSDFSMERLEPAARTTAVEGQQPQRDKPAKSRRRPASRPRPAAEDSSEKTEDSPHKIDSLA